MAGMFATAPPQGGTFATPGHSGGMFAGSTAGPSSGNLWGKVLGFGGSALDSFPEMFGLEPPESVTAFRAANPVSGFVSQLVGLAVPYGLAAKGVRAVPALAGIIDRSPEWLLGAANVAERPIAASAIRWGTEAAMLEAGRVGLALTPIPEALSGRERSQSAGELIGGAALNTAFGAGLGGVAGAIGSRIARGPRVWDIVPEAHPSQPLPVRMRALYDAVETRGFDPAAPEPAPNAFDEPTTQMLRFQLDQLKRANFADIEPGYNATGHVALEGELGAKRNYEVGKYIAPLVDDVSPRSGKDYTAAINTLATPDNTVGRVADTKLLTLDPKRGFATQADLDEAFARTGLTRDELALVAQHPRIIRVNEGTGQPGAGQRTATAVENLLTGRRPGTIRGGNPMARVANDWFVAREQDNGMWLAAKKINGTVGKPAPGDQYLLFKTDRPEVLDPQAAKFRDVTVDRSAYWPSRVQPDIGVSRFDLANNFERMFGSMQFIPKHIRPSPAAFAAMGKEVAGDALAYAAPLVGVAGRSNRANYIVNLLKTLTDSENDAINTILRGPEAPAKPGQSAAEAVASFKGGRSGGLADFYKTLDDADWADVQAMLELRVPYEKMREFALAGHITPKAYQVLDGLESISRANVEEFSRLAQIVGAPNAENLIKDFTARRGHYGITEGRDGGFYAYVADNRTGELRGVVAGNTAGEARDKATALILKHGKRGEDLTYAGMSDDLLKDEGRLDQFRAAVRKPGFLKERGELLGAEQYNGPLNAEKFTRLVERNLRVRERYKTNVVLQEKAWYPMQRLAAEDRTAHAQLEKRLAILQGDEGKFAEFQNRAVDKVLGSVLGRDSASLIVQNTQKLMNAFQFGFGNLAHYALNGTSMFQTTFPEAAFVLRTAGKDMSNYITVPLSDSGGRTVGAVGVLSDVKLFGNALKRVFSKDGDHRWTQLIHDMRRDGQITGHYAEAHVDASDEIVRDLRGAFRDGRSFLRWAGAINEVGLSKSEQFNRVVGVATAFELGKILGIADDPFRLARFTREFLSKTAFNYTTVDRPTIFTTPLGSLAGTFKTWMFHYMANMAKYATGAAENRELLAPLLWQTAATALIGGAAATPVVKPMADAASHWLSDKSFMQTVYDGVGPDHEKVADGIMYGLPGALGLSLAAQASTPGSDPARDASMLFGFAVYDRMRAFARATGDAVTAWKATGVGPWEDDRTRNELIRALAPRTIYRAMSVIDDQAIKSLNTGYRVLDHVGLGDAFLYSAGFNPVELDKAYTAYTAIRKDQAAQRAMVSELGRQMAQAWEDGDDIGASRVFTSALAQGLDTASVLRSAKARQERGQTTQLDFAIGKDNAEAAADWSFVTDDEGQQP